MFLKPTNTCTYLKGKKLVCFVWRMHAHGYEAKKYPGKTMQLSHRLYWLSSFSPQKQLILPVSYLFCRNIHA
jgi:hypothetical protein